MVEKKAKPDLLLLKQQIFIALINIKVCGVCFCLLFIHENNQANRIQVEEEKRKKEKFPETFHSSINEKRKKTKTKFVFEIIK